MSSEPSRRDNLYSGADRVDESSSSDFPAHGPSDIGSLIEPYRRELHLHCYRLLGSLHDAEDQVQETMLRAWRHFDTFKGSASLRTWLYTVATNACLDALKKRSPRTLPTAGYARADPRRPIGPPIDEAIWLEPYPDTWMAEAAENPEARYTRLESVSLAFLTAIQLLPPRQRAILILSDVLDWHASEIAHQLELSVSAVNSALHRARVTLEKNYHGGERERVPESLPDAQTSAILSRYVRAWETDDVAGLVALLKEDAILNMPPYPSWYRGREAIRTILDAAPFRVGMQKRWRLSPTHANGQPAFALYRADESKTCYRAYGLQLITIDHARLPGQIAEVTIFHLSSLVTSFGLPPGLPV